MSGSVEWIKQYKDSFVHPETLQNVVDEFMKNFDKMKEEVSAILLHMRTTLREGNVFGFYFDQEEERLKQEEEQQKEDEEGWVKVSRGNKARPHSEAADRKTLQKEMRKKKRKELLNFYSWQHKNTQKERKLAFFYYYSSGGGF